MPRPFSNPGDADWLFLPKDKGRGPPTDGQWWTVEDGGTSALSIMNVKEKFHKYDLAIK